MDDAATGCTHQFPGIPGLAQKFLLAEWPRCLLSELRVVRVIVELPDSWADVSWICAVCLLRCLEQSDWLHPSPLLTRSSQGLVGQPYFWHTGCIG